MEKAIHVTEDERLEIEFCVCRMLEDFKRIDSQLVDSQLAVVKVLKVCLQKIKNAR